MATIKINNADALGHLKSIECQDTKDGKIQLTVNCDGKDRVFTLNVNDAQLLQSWLFLSIKKIKMTE